MPAATRCSCSSFLRMIRSSSSPVRPTIGDDPHREGARAASRCRVHRRVRPRRPYGMIVCHTVMPKTKVALTLDAELLEQVDDLVVQRRFRNRSQAIEAALADKLHRLARTRLAREAAKLNPTEEKRLADEGMADALDAWPEY